MAESLNQAILKILAEQQSSRRKCFISYYSGDKVEVDNFLRNFGDVFIPKAIGISDGDDFIDSNNIDYVMGKIRTQYLGDSTVTICLIGSCTHSRRYIDWELKTTLRKGGYTPNGLLGLLLPSMGTSGHLPPRFKENWDKNQSASYAIYHSYPTTKDQLSAWIEEAYQRRTTHADHINNSQDMLKYNSSCLVHSETH
jgi:hypothetical protein